MVRPVTDRLTGCLGKIRYDTRPKAVKVVKAIDKRGPPRSTAIGIYRCGFCGGYHLGGEKKKQAPPKGVVDWRRGHE